MLVHWPQGPGSPIGWITNVNGNRISVRFDGESEPRAFSSRAGVLERLPLGHAVERFSTGEVGFVHEPTGGSPPRWRVLLGGRIVSIPEADLRPYRIDSPETRIADGELGTPEQFQLAVTARRTEIGNLANDLLAVNESRVDLKPHQVGVVHRVVSSYPHRFLLCDEVGLGKTIEAGMILKELRARGAAKRTLIIAPPNLMRQWQFELKSKFNQSFSILNSGTVKYLRSTRGLDGNPFEVFDSVIVSSKWITGRKWAGEAKTVPWDMVIVDEAHHARVRGRGRSRRETNLLKTVRSLVAPDAFSRRAALLLTATPMQLDSSELYALVEILDPALFPSEEHFDRHRSSVIGLSQLVHELGEQGAPPVGLERDEVIERISTWLPDDPTAIAERLDGGADAIRELCGELAAQHLLSEILIRNRKKIIGGFMGRHARQWEVDLTGAEREALEAVQRYVRDGYAKAESENDRSIGWVMVWFQKMLASSIRALRKSLDKRRSQLESLAAGTPAAAASLPSEGELEAQLDEDCFVDVGVARAAADHTDEIATLVKLLALLDAIPRDSKGDALVSHLDELRTEEPDAKVLLFTEFRETQEYLRECLEDTGWNVQLFHGQLTADAKDLAVESFRNATGPSILISTEAGGEGRNLQFCHLLVNYDLPWNPMRVEQRIGRVDRIGQEHEVKIFNFCVRGTIEERILEVLDRRIRIFEETVGGLDPILGDTEKDLKKIMQLGEDERDKALDKLAKRYEQQVTRAREADARSRDFIMETKSYSREIASTLSIDKAALDAAAQEKLVTQLLSEVRTHLHRNTDDTWRVTFNEPFRSEHPELCEGELRIRTVAFRPDVQSDSEHVEYFAPGNPIVDQLISRVTEMSYPGIASAFQVDQGNLPSPAGWLLVYEINIPGLHDLRELMAVFIDDDGNIDHTVGEQLLNEAGTLDRRQPIRVADVPTDRLDNAREIADSAAEERILRLEAQAAAESRQAIEQQRQKILNYFAYREINARDRLEASNQTLQRLEGSTESDVRKAIPMWKARVTDDETLITELEADRERRLNELNQKLDPRGDHTLIAVAWVAAGTERSPATD